MPYWLTLLLALDLFGAAAFFNRLDVCISTLCDIVDAGQSDRLKLYKWQRAVLARLAKILNLIQRDHCKLARQHDRDRAMAILKLTEQ